jgi:hypothetical protein
MAKKRRRRTRQEQQPLHKRIVKTAMVCLKQRPGATHQQIEHKLMNIYKKEGLDQEKHKESIKQAISELMKTHCIKKRGPYYQIVCASERYFTLL